MSAPGQHAAATDAGRKRRRNEDAYVVQPPVFAVADGMGGAQAGQLASRLAASAVEEAQGERAGAAGEERVAALVQDANRRVYERSSADESVSGMGTTMTAALVADDRVYVGHVGDSRAYRLRGGRLEQLTEDHSLVGELMRSGKLSPEEAETHPQRSVITRALGTDPDVDVDTFSVDAAPGDVFVLCSDGLTTMVDADTIRSLVEGNRSDLERAAKSLVDAANRAGGEDNITVVVFDIVDARPADESTQTLPAAAPALPAIDDEDTLSGLEHVPAIDDTMLLEAGDWGANGHQTATAPAPPAPAPERAPAPAVPRTRRGRRRVSRLALLLGSLAVVLAAAAAALWGLSRSYFVGATHDGHVAVYQGFPWNLTSGVHLYRARYVSPLLVAQLSQPERLRLFDHDLESYDDALRTVHGYEAQGVP